MPMRFLSPSRGPSGSSRSGRKDKGKEKELLDLQIHVGNYGIVFLPPPEQHDDPTEMRNANGDQPANDPVLTGELEITLPLNAVPRRCKGIRVGVRTICKLDLGQGRRHEEDILFERKVEIKAPTAEGIVLEPGSQR